MSSGINKKIEKEVEDFDKGYFFNLLYEEDFLKKRIKDLLDEKNNKKKNDGYGDNGELDHSVFLMNDNNQIEEIELEIKEKEKKLIQVEGEISKYDNIDYYTDEFNKIKGRIGDIVSNIAQHGKYKKEIKEKYINDISKKTESEEVLSYMEDDIYSDLSKLIKKTKDTKKNFKTFYEKMKYNDYGKTKKRIKGIFKKLREKIDTENIEDEGEEDLLGYGVQKLKGVLDISEFDWEKKFSVEREIPVGQIENITIKKPIYECNRNELENIYNYVLSGGESPYQDKKEYLEIIEDHIRAEKTIEEQSEQFPWKKRGYDVENMSDKELVNAEKHLRGRIQEIIKKTGSQYSEYVEKLNRELDKIIPEIQNRNTRKDIELEDSLMLNNTVGTDNVGGSDTEQDSNVFKKNIPNFIDTPESLQTENMFKMLQNTDIANMKNSKQNSGEWKPGILKKNVKIEPDNDIYIKNRLMGDDKSEGDTNSNGRLKTNTPIFLKEDTPESLYTSKIFNEPFNVQDNSFLGNEKPGRPEWVKNFDNDTLESEIATEFEIENDNIIYENESRFSRLKGRVGEALKAALAVAVVGASSIGITNAYAEQRKNSSIEQKINNNHERGINSYTNIDKIVNFATDFLGLSSDEDSYQYKRYIENKEIKKPFKIRKVGVIREDKINNFNFSEKYNNIDLENLFPEGDFGNVIFMNEGDSDPKLVFINNGIKYAEIIYNENNNPILKISNIATEHLEEYDGSDEIESLSAEDKNKHFINYIRGIKDLYNHNWKDDDGLLY